MPFAPQKKDRGKPGFWPKPSPTAPQTVPNPAFSLHLVKHPVTSTAATSSPWCRTAFYASSLTVGWECFYGRGQRPRRTSSLADLCSHGLSYHCFRPCHKGASPVQCCFCSCFIPYSLTEPAPCRVTPDPPC